IWATVGGYPRLILAGHRLSVRSSDAVRKDIDLSTLGEAEIVTLDARRSAPRVYLGFPPLPGATHTPSRFAAPDLQRFAETVLLNGYTGGDPARAIQILEIVNARRLEPVQAHVPSASGPVPAARIERILTAGVFAALWVALVWWR